MTGGKQAMDEAKQGEIAVRVLKAIIGNEGLHLNDSLYRKLGQLSKQTGIDLEDLRLFTSVIIRELLEEFVERKGVKKEG